MDFTGITLQHQYEAVVAERERRIARDAWRTRWKRLNDEDALPSCCADEGPHHDNAPVHQPAAGPLPS